MTQPRIYPDLATQLQCFLLRRGPTHVMRVVQGLRHNGAAKDVHATIDDHPELFARFQYEHHNGKMHCSRGCVRLLQQKESDYVPEEDRRGPRTPIRRSAPAQEAIPVAGTSDETTSEIPDFL